MSKLKGEINFLKNKIVYLAPYNNLTVSNQEKLIRQGVIVKGFFDLNKRGKNIHNYDEELPFDYVLVESPNYWKQIVNNFPSQKVLLCNKFGRAFVLLDEYQEAISKKQYFDVLFLPFNRSNVIDLAMISRELSNFGLTSALIDSGDSYESNVALGLEENNDIVTVSRDALSSITHQALVASIDWEPSFGRHFIENERQQGKLTIGIVDGIEDFDDTDYEYKRAAYQTVEYVLTMGKDDQLSLTNKLEKTSVVGLPKLYPLSKEIPIFPKNDLVVINVNFTYGTFENAREQWLNDVVSACQILNLDYVISHHHADEGDLNSYNVSSDSAYDTLRKGSILISRFSTLILESLVLGKPVVYFNPHGEKVSIYKNTLGAFSVANTVNQLASMIASELNQKENTRERAKTFLDNKCNFSSSVAPAKLAAYRINNLIEEDQINFSNQTRYRISPHYVARNQYHHYDDSECEDEWQLEIYLHALGLMITNEFTHIADVGCGSGYKLVKYFEGFSSVGYELPVNVDILKKRYPDKDWRVSDFTKKNEIKADVIVCSDVIEHLIEPDDLLNYLKNQSFEYLIVSTPDRDLCYSDGDVYLSGPPKNKAHQREWNFNEFRAYMDKHFDVVDHRVTNLQQATQMVICKMFATN